MILYLCRHGIAADATGKMADADRPLTLEGIKKFRMAAAGFAALEPGVSHILSSPLLRARQTAELLADALAQRKQHAEIDVLECLLPGETLETLVRAVRGLKKIQDVVAVGHEPQMSAYLAQLCLGGAGGATGEGGGCEFKKGAMAAIELAERGVRGKLLWLLQPKQLRGLAE